MGNKASQTAGRHTLSLAAPTTITSATAESFRGEIERRMIDIPGWRTLDLNFHSVSRIDTRGLVLLVEVIKSANDLGKKVRLIAPCRAIRSLLSSTRIDQHAEILEL